MILEIIKLDSLTLFIIVIPVAAIGIAAHEVGHAIQHAEGYFPIQLRNAILPVANIGSMAAMPLVLLGIVFSWQLLVTFGIMLYTALVVFQPLLSD